METKEKAEVAVNITEELMVEETWKDKFMRLAMALLYEKKEGGKWTLSVGRVSWWLSFGPALYIWTSSLGESDISEHHLTVLLVLAGYNLGKKVIEGIKKKTTEE